MTPEQRGGFYDEMHVMPGTRPYRAVVYQICSLETFHRSFIMIARHTGARVKYITPFRLPTACTCQVSRR